jgi:predicted aspartyl protease
MLNLFNAGGSPLEITTANGSVLVAPALLKEVKVGEPSVRDVQASF